MYRVEQRTDGKWAIVAPRKIKCGFSTESAAKSFAVAEFSFDQKRRV